MQQPNKKKKILCVGLVCLDIISVVDSYPEEDTDTRCVSQRWQRGGNASNSCTVLSLLGEQTAFMGSLASGPVSDFILKDFQTSCVDVSLCSEHAQCDPSSSVVVSSRHTGSRTILHYNNRFILSDFLSIGVDVSCIELHTVGQTACACCLVCPTTGSRTVTLSDTSLPEVSRAAFSSKVKLQDFKWIHFEGRNASEQVHMINMVDTYNDERFPRQPQDATHTRSVFPWQQPERITVSVEIEKTREELYQLFDKGDLVLVSKDVARHFGFTSTEEALRGFYHRVRPGAVLVCAWAERGAGALGPDGVIVQSEAFPPDQLIDTLGAGDTFNSALIYSLCKGGSVQEALTFGCRVAGAKCGFHGYDDIRGRFGGGAKHS